MNIWIRIYTLEITVQELRLDAVIKWLNLTTSFVSHLFSLCTVETSTDACQSLQFPTICFFPVAKG